MQWHSVWRGSGRKSAIGSINIQTYGTKCMMLLYQTTDQEGNKTTHQEVVQMTTVTSNLGKGMLLYFVCPQTGRRCRKLYRCYDSPIWKSRQAYTRRIYYDSQICSKMNYPNDRWWDIEHLLPKLATPVRRMENYAGKPTRRYQRIYTLWDKQAKFDKQRWSPVCMNLTLRRQFMNDKTDEPASV